MPFNTALSGIRAANQDLRITGNNIANASTTGFKQSRAEFGDVYATSVLGSGLNQIGSGVRVQDVAQQFAQGNIAFTENTLDLAISGGGFFVVSQNGDQLFTRSGAFSLDQEGYVINNTNARLQGFTADSAGSIGGVIGDLQIETDNLAPQPTTSVNSQVNLDSTEEVIQRSGTTFSSTGNAVGVTQVGFENPTTTNIDSGTFNLPLANNFNTTPVTFDISLSGSSGNNGTVSITLSTASGVPATVSNFNDLRTLASVINSQIFAPSAPQTSIDVFATAIDLGGGNYQLNFEALQEGESSTVAISNPSANANQVGLGGANPPGALEIGIPAVSNGYPSQSIDIINPDGDTLVYTSTANNTAAQTASELNALTGVSATANTSATLLRTGFLNSSGNLQVTINGVTLSSSNLDDMAVEINSLANSTLPGYSAEIDAGTNLVISSSIGDDMVFTITSSDDADRIEVVGNLSAPSQVLEVDTGGGLVTAGATDAANNAIIVGGSIDVILEEGYVAENPVPGIGLFSAFGLDNATEIVINEFDPLDPSTYNHATSVTIYDSLGNPHAMEQYFVRQPYDPNDPTTAPNHWIMYVQIDGENVGDPDTTLPSPQNTLPTSASYNLYFNTDGSFNTIQSDDVLISNWTPLDANGNEIGALAPLNVLQGGSTNIEQPATSSNFLISMEGTTQVGSPFEVNNVDQNGFPSGRLSGISFSDTGIIFARFTNGEAQVLGQLALADFTNIQGLQASSDTMWAQSFESGQPIIGPPGTASLGLVQAGALEESNVDLSEQLVNLIIAQRNFQASAKTIETADATTQTIINLR